MDKKIIMFVCNGNIHRSAIAEKIFNKILEQNKLTDKFKVISRGIAGSANTKPTRHKNITKYEDWQYSKKFLEELNIDITNHIATPITKEDAKNASTIITFDNNILKNEPAALSRQFPIFIHKMHLLSELNNKIEDVPDCHNISDLNFHRAVIKYIYSTLNTHWQKIIVWAK